MERNGVAFYIEDHALLYGFLAEAAEMVSGQAGLEAAKQATIRYARERGVRMAQRAKKDNMPLDFQSYFRYKEWIDVKGYNKGEMTSLTPYRQAVTKCGWNETWRAYGLEKYGALYCGYVDANLVKGFSPALTLHVDRFLSHGHASCDFDWGDVQVASESELQKIEREPQQYEAARTKDFLYHTAHILATFLAVYYTELGIIEGAEIVEKALGKYEKIMGAEKVMALQEESKQNFILID